MSKPVVTADQIAAINETVAEQQAQAQAMTESAALQADVITRATKVDDAFKALFNYYNTDIIGNYDLERKAINGTYVTAPVVEADIINVSNNPPSGRLVPTPPTTDIVRISQFDTGGYDGITNNYEQLMITFQATAENTLQNGISGSSPSVTPSTTTTTALTGTSTTLSVTDSSSITFSAGDVFIVSDGTNAAVVQVVTATSVPPSYAFDLTITLLIAPQGTINSGADIVDSFSGFDNTERSTKTASDPLLQPLMDSLISQLQSALNTRVARIDEQIAAIQVNADPDAVSQLSAALTAANSAKTFINTYLISTDISNTGLTSLSTERGTRTTFLSTRITDILANYTGQTENYYDKRYEMANNRGNTQKGTLRALKNAQTVQSTMNSMAASLNQSVATLNSILP